MKLIDIKPNPECHGFAVLPSGYRAFDVDKVSSIHISEANTSKFQNKRDTSLILRLAVGPFIRSSRKLVV